MVFLLLLVKVKIFSGVGFHTSFAWIAAKGLPFPFYNEFFSAVRTILDFGI